MASCVSVFPKANEGPILALLVLGVFVMGQAGAQRFGRPGQNFPQYPGMGGMGQHPPGQGGPVPGQPFLPGQPFMPGQRPFGGPGPGLVGPNYPQYEDAVDVGLGSPCEYDDSCYSIEHTYCRNQQTCECKAGFQPSATGDRCLANVGARCSTKYDCSGLGPAGECLQGVCDCADNYVPSPDGTCLRGALKMDDACDLDLQCETLGDGTVCVEGKCHCAPGKHSYNNKCIANVGLHETCSETGQCFIGLEYQGIVTCKTGKCLCQDNYIDIGDGKCISGANGLKSVLTSVVLALLIQFRR